jgi:cyclophilin family peptidyl-prolyl cis-trans isomerase
MKRFLALSALISSLCFNAFAHEPSQPPAADQAGEAGVGASDGATSPAVPPTLPPAIQRTGPEVKLETSLGDILIVLDPEGAPKTVEQFLKLVKDRHYNGAIFYRIEPGFVIQFGDLDAKLNYRAPKRGKVPLETARNRHSRGAVALARGEEADSGQSTVYIDLAENSGLDATAGAPSDTTGYAVFGHVIEGMDIVDTIANVELSPEGGPFPGKLPKTPVVIKRATVTKD